MSISYPAGYFNEFTPASNYSEVLALAGFVEQSREDNEIQSILKNIFKAGFDTLYANGELVSGGQLIRLSTPNTFTLNAAKIYLNGIVFSVPTANLTLSGIGVETIGVTLTTTVVTAAQDPTLTDPATGYLNFGQPGAARLKQVCAWTLNDPKAVPLYTFNNGLEQAQPIVGTVDVVTPALARRTYDEAGDFVVAGFDMTAAPLSTQQLQVVVGNKSVSGTYNGSKAYVQGNEIIKLVPSNIAIDRPLDARSVLGQQFVYTGATELFAFPSQPVITGGVDQVLATFDVIRTVSNHNYNGFDQLTQTGETLISVIAAYASGTPAAQTTPYVQATSQAGPGDFYQSGNGVGWDVAGSTTDPVVSGGSYQVYFTVSRLVPSTQYAVTQSGGVSNFDTTLMSPKPYHTNQVTGSAVNSLNMDVNYHFQLSRIDAIYLNPDGTLGLSKGSPEVKPTAPLTPGGVLGLGQILLPAGTDYDKAVVTQYATKRLTMADLQKALTRLQNTEYNIAKLDLDSEAQTRAGNSITTLKGILTESFTYSASDIKNDGVGGVSLVKFVRADLSGPMIDVQNRQLVLPQHVVDASLIPVTSTGATAAFSAANIMMPYTSVVMLNPSQLAATEAVPVNKFALSTKPPKYQKLNIWPSSDTTPEIQSIVLNTVDPTSALLVATNYNVDQHTFNTQSTATSNLAGFTTTDTYVCDQWIRVYGSGFKPSTALYVTMDGKLPSYFTLAVANTSVPNARPILALPSGTVLLANPVTFSGTGVLGIFDATTNLVITNSDGAFDFFMRTPTVPLLSGNKVISVTSNAGDSASQIFVAEATKTVNIGTRDVTTQVAQSFGAVTAPVPFISNVVVQNNSGHTAIPTGSDGNLVITASTLLEYVVTFDLTKGAMPTFVWVKASDGSDGGYKTQINPQTFTANSVTIVMASNSGTTGAGLTFTVLATGVGGAAISWPKV